MKKLLTAVLSAVLCLGMSVTAMAATSPSTSIPSSPDVTMGAVSNAYTNANAAQREALDAYAGKITSAGSMEAAATELITATVGASNAVEFASLIDVSATDLSKPVRFAAPGISAGNAIVVLHLKADGTWENIPATAGNGYIDGTFTSLSPVMYAKLAVDATHHHSFDQNVVAPTENTWGYTLYTCECGYSYADNYVAPTNGAAAAASPKTADSVMPVIAMMTAVAMLGMALVVRRKEA